jgi:ubiquinone biosynthesis protein
MKLLAVRRLLRIQRVVIRYRLDDLLFEPCCPGGCWRCATCCRGAGLPRKPLDLSRGARLRLALQDLGPIFIKFGQILSTRRDLLPEDIADELMLLQDRVPPFDSQLSALIEEQLGKKISEVFSRFDVEPLASASVAQVHAAQLKTGEEVVVKVIRPGLKPVIAQDLAWLFILARAAERSPPTPACCTRWTWSATTKKPSTTNSTCCAKRPTPASCGATSKARRCCTCPRCTGTGAGPRCW